MNLFYRKEEMFAKVQEHLKFKNKNMPIYLAIDIIPTELDNVLTWMKGKLYVLELKNLVNSNICDKLFIKLQLINNIPKGWKVEFSNTKID